MIKKKNKNNKRILLHIIVGFIYILSFTIIFLADWGKACFNVSIEEIIFTISNPVEGSNITVVEDAIFYCISRLIIVLILFLTYTYIDCKNKDSLYVFCNIKNKKIKINLSKFFRSLISIGCCIVFAFSIFKLNSNFGIIDYLKLRAQSTTIYEEYYVDPAISKIKLKNENEEYRNLIYIYLESMENTYTSIENGGFQNVCYMPNLANLANKNISFSNSDKLGGFFKLAGTGWTMGSILGSTAGIPFSYPIGGNNMAQMTYFAPNLTSLGDILKSFGYNQYFLCGSDASYGGRKKYFKQHGNYEILDLFYARDKGYISKDYYKWWGFEDKILFDIAKKELLEISSKDKPFNFTMLTIDAHHEGGFVCDLCENKYDKNIKNVINCTDKQVYEFIEWCKKQSFYENTTIVIVGDHPRMDTHIVENVNPAYRTMYNCFINSKYNGNFTKNNRCYSILDIFPTTLTSLGFEWNSDRLGLGTDLFSSTKTLPEELGLYYFETELKKYSKYYADNFY